MKNYICFINDHSGSMSSLATAACNDFNANITAIKNAASAEMLDTVVSVAEVNGNDTKLTVTVSNPHVLKPLTRWVAGGGTPLWDGFGLMIEMLKKLPDINNPDVSVLVISTTDGGDTGSYKFPYDTVQKMMAEVMNTGRWTFVARVPEGMNAVMKQQMLRLGIPEANIQSWKTSAAGMAESTAATTAAMTGYFRSRSAGAKSSSTFYSDASKVDITALTDITNKVSLYIVPAEDMGIEIRPFILRHRMEYLKGSAFYQLTKTEARVQHDKLILVRDRASGKIFAGNDARKMIGLPTGQNARLHPGDHKNFDIFVQSQSINRKLVAGTGVIYWKEIGVPFTQAELDKFLGPVAAKPLVQAPVVLPAVPVRTAPTKSPIPVTKREPAIQVYDTREEARRAAAAKGVPQSAIQKRPGVRGQARWAI